MIADAIEDDDIDTLAEILQREHESHKRKCGVCLLMFVVAFAALAAALAVVAVRLASVLSSPAGAMGLGLEFGMFQVLAPLTAVALSFFGAWWAAQNCLNSMERALCAARNRRVRLFQTFLGQIQCASREKQRAWLEIIKTAIM